MRSLLRFQSVILILIFLFITGLTQPVTSSFGGVSLLEERTALADEPTPTVLDLQVGAGSDDCIEDVGGYYSHTGGNLNFGYFNATYTNFDSGVRFTNVTVPQGATITAAYLSFRAKYGGSGLLFDAVIKGIAEDNTPTWSESNKPSQRSKTAANVTWNMVAWTPDQWYNTPSITSIIQGIVNRSEWASGNSLALVVENDTGDESGELRQPNSYVETPADAPKLHIEYVSGGYTPTPTPTLTPTPTPSPPDTTPPVISNVQAINITQSSATITWTTDDLSDSTVNYGLTGSFGLTRSDSGLVTSHSINLTGLLSKTTYYYQVSSCNSDNYCSNSSTYSLTTVPALGGSTTVGTLELAATFECISVYSNFAGDEDGNNQAILEYREVGGSWKQGMAMTVDRRDTIKQPDTVTNLYKNQWRASILGLQAGTEYEVRVTFSDPDGVVVTNPVVSSISTRIETDLIPSIGTSYYVSQTGSDANLGTETLPFKTIQKAADIVNPGDTVYVKAGTYPEKVFITRSGTSNNYITFRNYGTDTVVIDPPGSNEDRLTRGIDINAQYLRIKGFEIRDTNRGISISSDSAFVIVEDNFVTDFGSPTESGIGIAIGGLFQNDEYTRASNVANITVQNNIIHYTIRPAYNDRGGIDATAGNPGGHVIRNNMIEFFFSRDTTHGEDCISETTNDPGGSDRHGFKDTDIYGNLCIGAPDDAIELDGTNPNTRVWDNIMIKNNLIGISIAASSLGPTYVFRNVIYDWENNPYSCQFIKEGRGGSGYVYFYHNTIYMPQADCGFPADTHKTIIATDAGGSSASNMILKNNIFYYGDRVVASTSDYEFDYNLIWDEGGQAYVAKLNGIQYSWAEWQVLGQEVNGVFGQPQFVDPVNGNFQLATGSPGIDQGVLIPGFNDENSPWPYRDSAPDLGAFEYDSGGPQFYADFSAGPREGVAGRTVFTFTNETAGGTAPYTYEWDFNNDGVVDSTAANPTHVYANAGTYTVTLTATDSLSTSNTKIKTGYTSVYDSGDANKDGYVNSIDITRVEMIIVMLADPTPGADANGDGNINAIDITRVELIIIGG